VPAGAEFCSERCAERFAEWSRRQLDRDEELELVTESDPQRAPAADDGSEDRS